MTKRFRSAAEAEAYLLSLINYEVQSGYERSTRTHDLTRFRRLLARARWDPDAYRTVHVGGTNGKGSVATLLARILQAGGLRTGLYTSPHLRDIRERIQVNGAPIPKGAFRDGVGRLAGLFGSEPGAGFRTTFEHLTALAFTWFQEAGTDVSVVEVGLGGKLDATNVLLPGDAVLTPVALDHQNILGNTVGRIAADKAHIFKSGGRAWIMPQGSAARRAILRRLDSQGMDARWTEDEVAVGIVDRSPRGLLVKINGREAYGEIQTRLLGDHQASNLAAAAAVAEALLPPERVRAGIQEGLRRASVPGRLQILIRKGRTVILDGGHNPHAAGAVAEALREVLGGRRIPAVIGLAGDKDIRGYLQALEPVIERWVFTRSGNPRAADPQALLGAAPKVPGGAVTAAQLDEALSRVDGADTALVAGSFILVGEALALLT